VCDGDACRTSACASDAECGVDYRCGIAAGATHGECVVRTDAFCKDEHTSVGRDGASQTCDPYRCTPTGCATSCASSADCLGGYLCDDALKTCVAGSAPSGASQGGCATSNARGSLGGGALVIALAAIGRLVRRRRDRQSARECGASTDSWRAP
jgi:hypothetical protein